MRITIVVLDVVWNPGREVQALDHIVLAVQDVARTRHFYERVLGMETREERPWQVVAAFRGQQDQPTGCTKPLPPLALHEIGIPGSGNFCLLTDTPIEEVVAHLRREGVDVFEGPGERAGATGTILSVYFKDPDGNLVEVSHVLHKPTYRNYGGRPRARA